MQEYVQCEIMLVCVQCKTIQVCAKWKSRTCGCNVKSCKSVCDGKSCWYVTSLGTCFELTSNLSHVLPMQGPLPPTHECRFVNRRYLDPLNLSCGLICFYPLILVIQGLGIAMKCGLTKKQLDSTVSAAFQLSDGVLGQTGQYSCGFKLGPVGCVVMVPAACP